MKEILSAALFCTALILAPGAVRAEDGPMAAGSISIAPDLDAPVADAPAVVIDKPVAGAPPSNGVPEAAMTGPDQTGSSLKVDLPPGADYPLEVAGAYSFATAPAQKNGAAFMALQNIGKVDAVLTGASSSVAEKVELHTMSMENGVMQMRPVDQFVIPAGGTLIMAPHSHHIMLIGLKSPLKVGDDFSIQLRFSNYPPMDTTFKVTAPGQAMEMDMGHHRHMMMHDGMGCGMMKGMKCPMSEEKAQEGETSAPAQE